MKKHSAGILLYRESNGNVEVLLGHPGGPFFARKDQGVWSIPKGEYDEGESPLDAAKREFTEETGQPLPAADYVDLGSVKRSDGKVIYAWAAQGDIDVDAFRSNTFEMEWPPKSGRRQQFPEIDQIAWLPLHEALAKLSPAQTAFIERLAAHLGKTIAPDESQ